MSQTTIDTLTKKIKALEKENKSLRRGSQQTNNRIQVLQTILDNVPAPIYLKDAEGKYILINKKYEYLSDVLWKQVKGKTDFDIFPAPVAELFRSQDDEVKKQKIPLEFEETVSLVDGEHTFITLKFPVTDIHGTIHAIGGFCTDITERTKFEEEKKILIQNLQKALDEVTILRGIIPICASCKSIRDDKGYWNQIEAYFTKYSDVKFTHSLCPLCMEKIFGREEWYQKKYATRDACLPLPESP
jgi:PAS domain S-box-containing protein